MHQYLLNIILRTLSSQLKNIKEGLLFFFFCLFAFSRAASVAHGDSQARDLIGAVAMPEPQQCGV